MTFGGEFFFLLPCIFQILYNEYLFYVYNLKNTKQCEEDKEYIRNVLALLPLSQLDTDTILSTRILDPSLNLSAQGIMGTK